MNNPTIWPQTLWLVRHGESAGNVAREAADATGLEIIDINVRDVDVPLSPLGERQSAALGKWFAQMPSDARPNVVLSPPLQARAQDGGNYPPVRQHRAAGPG